MNEAVLILPNMRGGCATVGNTVHTLFRVTSRRPRDMARPDGGSALGEAGRRDNTDACLLL
ncbi:MAG: hypothetical protein Q7J60_13290 [Bradyrhizobium sp.]|uniref:hypothetical protein n=1 Tax=Bradyrhizobium sp. TaxID=376 RepID=UPI00271DB671|nr:hypothetical protein [Bradyrhizobium sp.]MDO9562586.1 hypothetical protein [Bradyrhizobium sp.]MDP3691651.1 hypothetical protein [Bradyrhizobium sp.]